MSEALQLRIKEVIVESLMLEDVTPAEIKTDDPLFVEGLGLDSIDALELAVALHKEFGVKTKADDERNRELFASVGSLAKFIEAEQAKAAAGDSDSEESEKSGSDAVASKDPA